MLVLRQLEISRRSYNRTFEEQFEILKNWCEKRCEEVRELHSESLNLSRSFPSRFAKQRLHYVFLDFKGETRHLKNKAHAIKAEILFDEIERLKNSFFYELTPSNYSEITDSFANKLSELINKNLYKFPKRYSFSKTVKNFSISTHNLFKSGNNKTPYLKAKKSEAQNIFLDYLDIIERDVDNLRKGLDIFYQGDDSSVESESFNLTN